MRKIRVIYIWSNGHLQTNNREKKSLTTQEKLYKAI